jgi:hypothetical protein
MIKDKITFKTVLIVLAFFAIIILTNLLTNLIVK